MADAPFRNYGAPVFVYTGNILNYVGDKLEGEICIARGARPHTAAGTVSCGCGTGVIRKIDCFFRALAGDIRRYESGLMTARERLWSEWQSGNN